MFVEESIFPFPIRIKIVPIERKHLNPMSRIDRTDATNFFCDRVGIVTSDITDKTLFIPNLTSEGEVELTTVDRIDTNRRKNRCRGITVVTGITNGFELTGDIDHLNLNAIFHDTSPSTKPPYTRSVVRSTRKRPRRAFLIKN